MIALLARLSIASFLVSAATAAYSYDANATNGPDDWATLDLGTGVTNECGGPRNSPIAFNTSSCDTFADYVFQPGTCTVDNLHGELLSNAVEIGYPNSSVCTSSTVQFPGVPGTYVIKQFHIHTSSEHQINGGYFGAELHLVHQLVDGKLLGVVGIPIEPNLQDDNALFAPILDIWKHHYLEVLQGCNITSHELTASASNSSHRRLTVPSRKLESGVFSAYEMIPQGSSFYTYNGSLTTPPCTQSVWWNVVDKPLLVSVRQFEELTLILLGYRNTATCQKASIASPSGSTSRPVQPLNGRRVVRVCATRNVALAESGKTSAATTIMSMTSMALTGVVLMALAMI